MGGGGGATLGRQDTWEYSCCTCQSLETDRVLGDDTCGGNILRARITHEGQRYFVKSAERDLSTLVIWSILSCNHLWRRYGKGTTLSSQTLLSNGWKNACTSGSFELCITWSTDMEARSGWFSMRLAYNSPKWTWAYSVVHDDEDIDDLFFRLQTVFLRTAKQVRSLLWMFLLSRQLMQRMKTVTCAEVSSTYPSNLRNRVKQKLTRSQHLSRCPQCFVMKSSFGHAQSSVWRIRKLELDSKTWDALWLRVHISMTLTKNWNRWLSKSRIRFQMIHQFLKIASAPLSARSRDEISNSE